MSAKQRSVRADAVFLVSHSGFTNTALTKAKQLGIRALIYDEATSSDWSNWLQCKTLSIHARKYENPVIAFSQFGSNTQMSISSTTMQVFENDKTAKILRTEDGTPYISIPDLINKIINSLSDKLYSDIKIDGARCKRTLLIDETKYEPALLIENNDGILCRIGKIKIEVDCFYECIEYPLKLMRYRKPDDPQSIAEIATTDIEIGQNKLRFEFIAPGASSYIPAGTTTSLRTTPLGQRPINERG